MKYIALLLMCTTIAYAAQDLPEVPPGAIVLEVDGSTKAEKCWVCIGKEGVEVRLAPHKDEPTSARLKRASEILKSFSKKVREDEDDAADAAKKAAKQKPKEPTPNAKPIPKTTSGKDTAWYSERTDDLIMVCPLPKLPRAEIVDIQAISHKE